MVATHFSRGFEVGRDDAACFYSPLAAEPDLAELVDLFVSDLSARVAEIRHYAQFEDWSEVRLLAHQLQEAGGSYSFPHLAEAAWEVRVAAKGSSPAAAVRESLEALQVACAGCRSGRPS